MVWRLQLPGVEGLVELTPAEAAQLARRLLALGPVRDHEALEVARALAEDLGDDGGEEPREDDDDAFEAEIAARQLGRQGYGES